MIPGRRFPLMRTFLNVLHFRFVLQNLVAKNIKVLYRNMALGFLWSLLNPLVLVVVLSAVWILFFQAGRDFPAFVLVALIPYNFFSYCLSGCTSSIVGNASLVKKVSFPRQILPISVVLTHLIHYAIQFLLILIVLLVLPPQDPIFTPRLLWLVPILIVHLGLCVGSGLLVAGLNVVYRDVQYVVDSVLTVLFWATPILYDAAKLLRQYPDWLYYLYFLNPLSGILEAYRSVLFRGSAPDATSLGMACAVTLVLGAVGVRLFWVHEREFADLV